MTGQADTQYAEGIEVKAPVTPEFAAIVTPDALNFVAALARTFEGRRQEL